MLICNLQCNFIYVPKFLLLCIVAFKLPKMNIMSEISLAHTDWIAKAQSQNSINSVVGIEFWPKVRCRVYIYPGTY